METKSLKALAIKVLQGNKQGNSKETHCIWIDDKVSDCQEPCLVNDKGIVTRECPHFKSWWSGFPCIEKTYINAHEQVREKAKYET